MGAQDPEGTADLAGADGPDVAPPPTPFERPIAGPTAQGGAPADPPRPRPRRVVGTVLLVLVAVAGGALGGFLAAGGALDLPDGLRSREAIEAERAAVRDAELVALLTDITRTEGAMLAFNAALEGRLGGSPDEAAALALISRAAAESVGGLAALRPVIVARTGGRVDEVRDVYLPHLDSWVDYLSALADEPALLFSPDGQQPYILLINATADAFRVALEELLADGPSIPVGELAERILDDGFRSEGPAPNV